MFYNTSPTQSNNDKNRSIIWETRTIQVHGYVDEGAVRDTIEGITRLSHINKEPIYLNITSYGGSILHGFAMIDAIGETIKSGIPVIGRVLGTAMSMATFVLLTCSERIAYPNSIIMLHGLTSFTYGDLRNQDSERKVTDFMIDRMLTLLEKRTKKGREYWAPMMKDATPQYFTPNEALDLGIIDKIEMNY